MYEVKVGDHTEQFHLQFKDPTGLWAKNFFDARSSNDGRLTVTKGAWETGGHPFYGMFNSTRDGQSVADRA